jgi:hypothetical protein
LYAFVGNNPVNLTDPLGYAQRGPKRLDVNLPNGEILNKRTPLNKINQVIAEAAERGLSKGTLKALKALQKVVRREGEMALLMELLDPETLESAECPAGPGTCSAKDPLDPTKPTRSPERSGKPNSPSKPGRRGSGSGLPIDHRIPGEMVGRK